MNEHAAINMARALQLIRSEVATWNGVTETDSLIVYSVTPFDRAFSETPDHVAEINIRYSARLEGFGGTTFGAIFGVTADGTVTLYAN